MSAYGCFADVYDTLTSNIDYKELAGYYDRIITSHGGKRAYFLTSPAVRAVCQCSYLLSDMMLSEWT